MNMLKISLSIILCCYITTSSIAQGVADALRYSLFDLNSTARSVGVGNALGALGADFSVASTNPAGIAMFRSSEMVFTPNFRFENSNSELLSDDNNARNTENQFTFHLNTLGVVVAGRPRSPKWSTFNFAIGFNRVANFRREFFFQGSSPGTITDRFLELIDGGNVDLFEGEVAIDAEAVYDIDGDGVFETDFSFIPLEQPVDKSQRVSQRGSINEIVLSLAGNYSEKFMIGATIGVPFISFQEEKTYIETDDNDEVPFFEDLEFREFLTTTGVGINAKIGLIYRVNQMVRLGIAAHTPTAFALEDNFSTALDYNFLNNNVIVQGQGDSPDGDFNYNLRTPWRIIGSAGILIQKKGFISAELEWVDYTAANFRFDDFQDDADLINEDIDAILQSTLSFRVGGEYAYNSMRFRAGVNLRRSPFFDESSFNPAYSIGFGLRGESVYFDAALRSDNTTDNYSPYFTNGFPEQNVENNFTDNRLLLTLGIKF